MSEMGNKVAKIPSDASNSIAKDASESSPANAESLPSKKDSNESVSDAPVEKMFITWENDSNSCWLDSSLALLAHNQTMKHVINMNPNVQVSKAIKSFDKAISTLNDTTSNTPLEERMALAKSILQQSQESCLNYLQPLVKFQKGEPDSAFCSLLNLVKEDRVILGFFEATFTWVRYCDHCETQRVLTVTKPIITVARVEVFKPEDLVLPYQCQVCKKTDQKMKLLYKKLPECLFYHFEKGAGKGSDLPLKFTVASREYVLTSVMMLEKSQESNVNHFVSYIRDPQNGKWLECNDLNPEMVTFTELQPSFNLEDVFMYVFEAWDDLGTVEVEGEPSLISANQNIPCIDISDEEDKASPRKESDEKGNKAEANEDAETVENVRKFLMDSAPQTPVSGDLSGSECSTKPDSTAEVKESMRSQNVLQNNFNASELEKQDASKSDDATMREVNLPVKSVNIPVKGFDVEKFVEQKLSELATNQKAPFTVSVKTKANNISLVATDKEKEKASSIQKKRVRSRKGKDLENVTSSENFSNFKESSQSSKEFSRDTDSLALIENELIKPDIHHGEIHNDTVSRMFVEENENSNVSLSDTDGITDKIDDFSIKKDSESDKFVSVKPATESKSDKKEAQFVGDKSKNSPSIFSKKSKSQQSSIKAYFSRSNKNNNDSVLKRDDNEFDEGQISIPPKEALVELMKKTKLRKMEPNLAKIPMFKSKKQALENGYSNEQKSNVSSDQEDLSNLEKSSSKEDSTDISKNPDHSALLFLEQKVPMQTIFCENDNENDCDAILEQAADAFHDEKNMKLPKKAFAKLVEKAKMSKIQPKLAKETMLKSKKGFSENGHLNGQNLNVNTVHKNLSNLRKSSPKKDSNVIPKNEDHFDVPFSEKEFPMKSVLFEDEHDSSDDYDSESKQFADAFDDEKNPSSSKEPILQFKTKNSEGKIEQKLAPNPLLMPTKDVPEDSHMEKQKSNVNNVHKDQTNLNKKDSEQSCINIEKKQDLSALTFSEKVPKKSASFDGHSTSKITISSSKNKVVVFNRDQSPGHKQQLNSDYHLITNYNENEPVQREAQIIKTRSCKTYSRLDRVSTPNPAKKVKLVNLQDSSKATDLENHRKIGSPFTYQKPKCIEQTMNAMPSFQKSKAENQTIEAEMPDSTEKKNVHDFDTDEEPPSKKNKAEIHEKLKSVPSSMNGDSSAAAFVKTFPGVSVRNSSSQKNVLPVEIANNSACALVNNHTLPNGFTGIPPFKTIRSESRLVRSSICSAFAKKSPDSSCLKPGCQCYKMEREKALDVTVDYFLTQIFQIFPVKKN